MKKRLLIFSIILSVLAVLLFFGGSLIVTAVNNNNVAGDTVKGYTTAYSNLYDPNTDSGIFVSNPPNNIRVTLIAKDGTVLADSHENMSEMGNHLEREEVQSALQGIPKLVKRTSGTSNLNYMYYAIMKDNVVIRCAVTVTSINSYLYSSLPILITLLLIVVLISIYVSGKFSKKLLLSFKDIKGGLQEVNNGNYEMAKRSSSYQEVNEILLEIDDINLKLLNNIIDSQAEQKKLNYILDNINDALFAVNMNREIILVNQKASNIFDKTCVLLGRGIQYLTADEEIIQAINIGFETGEDSVFEYTLNNNHYIARVKMLSENWGKSHNELAVIMLTDITESKKRQVLREEFFANASHELKTPLTAVKGFTELLQIYNKDENIAKFIMQIAKETDRMVILISDMLKLAELENDNFVQHEAVDSRKICLEVIQSLQPLLDERGVVVDVIGNCKVSASSEHIYELVKNLVENAVKYNKQGGTVNITLKEERRGRLIVIKDSGIGIDASQQGQIFERFYRVEKSRSRQSGGTGLGLSIVKHICERYNAELSLISKIGVGTTVTIVFPKK